jgi:hypothetical protein
MLVLVFIKYIVFPYEIHTIVLSKCHVKEPRNRMQIASLFLDTDDILAVYIIFPAQELQASCFTMTLLRRDVKLRFFIDYLLKMQSILGIYYPGSSSVFFAKYRERS